VQVNDVLYAEVPLWCASGPIARWWIAPTCVWKLYDCKNGSECWKSATRGPVGTILQEWVFRYHKGRMSTCVRRVTDCVKLQCVDFLECNKVPSWIEAECVTILRSKKRFNDKPSESLHFFFNMYYVPIPVWGLPHKLATRPLTGPQFITSRDWSAELLVSANYSALSIQAAPEPITAIALQRTLPLASG
jgi:hypothetical protein